jgi:hypothetical protein
MRTYRRIIILFLLPLVFLFACRSNRDGGVEGTITPPTDGVRITALQDGKDMLTVLADKRDGTFKLGLPAGSYSITVTVPAVPYPLRFNDIMVKAGETTPLPPVELAPPPAGKASLSGRVTPPLPGAEIKLMYEGRERAAVHADREGKYEFKELPAGTYLMRANAPGHADDSAQVVINENQKAEHNAVLLPIVDVEGVDWTNGKIRARGIGLPPSNIASEPVRREMTKRAALADAQRNMLRTIERIRIDGNRDVKAAMRSANTASKIQGFLKGYTVVSERAMDGGRIEVVLELPLTGPGGLSRYLTEEP